MNHLLFSRNLNADTRLEEFSTRHLLDGYLVKLCEEMGIHTLGEMLYHHYKHFQFSHTKKENAKFQAFCVSYADFLDLSARQKFAPDLDEVKFETYLRHSEGIINELPLATRRYLRNRNHLRFYKEYIQGERSFDFLGSLSSKVFSQLESLRAQLRTIANELENKSISSEFDELIDTCVEHYGCERNELAVFKASAEAGNFALFGFISYLIEEGYLLNKAEMNIMEFTFGWGGSIHKTIPKNEFIQSTGFGDNLINYRAGYFPDIVRKRLSPLTAHKSFIKQQSSYNFDENTQLFSMSKGMSDQLNKNEEACLSTGLYGLIIQQFLMTEHCCFSLPGTWVKNSYLIRKEVIEGFNIGSLFNSHERALRSNFMANKQEEIRHLTRLYVRLNTLQINPIAEAIVLEILHTELDSLCADGMSKALSEISQQYEVVPVNEKITKLYPVKDQNGKSDSSVKKRKPTTKRETEPFGFYEHLEQLNKNGHEVTTS